MAITAKSIVRSIRRVESPWPLPRVLTAGAWFFVLFSLANLAWVVGIKWADPAGTTSLYEATTGVETHQAILLSYTGMTGLILSFFQIATVSTAAVLSTLPARRLRRIGHSGLITWSALWMLNLLHLASIDPGMVSIAQAGMMTALFGCTVFRATRRPAHRSILEEPSETSTAPIDHDRAKDPVRKLGDAHRRSRERAGNMAAAARSKLAPIAAKVRDTFGRAFGGSRQRQTNWLRGKGIIPQSSNKSTPV